MFNKINKGVNPVNRDIMNFRRYEDIKVGLSPYKKFCVIYLIESPLKMIKMLFISSRYLSFYRDFLVM